MKARRVKKLDPSGSLGENAARIVRVRLDEMRSFAPKPVKERGIKQQHDMRSASKRVDDVVEPTEFCFGRSAQVARRRARDLDEFLGFLNRWIVMLPRVEGHMGPIPGADSAAV